jgi:hypothetical protein
MVPSVPAPSAPPPGSGFLSVDVTVTRTDPNDTRSGTLPAGLTYFWPPEVDAVSPPQGPTLGGTDVVVSGRFFRVITGQPFLVTFDGVACTDLHVTSSTSLTCTTPPGDPGFADVSARNESDSTGTKADAYLYVAPPRVDSTDPPEGPTFGGDDVTVHGAFFQPNALVFFDGAPCSDVQVVDAQTITCITPPGAEGTADVRVLNVDGQDGVGVGIYDYEGVAVTPDHGLPIGFAHVRVRSAGMQPGVTVLFGGNAAACTFASSHEVDCETPASTLPGRGRGDVDVTFVNPDGSTETGTAAFSYRVYVQHNEDLDLGGDNANDVDLADMNGDGSLDAVVVTGNEFFGPGNTEVQAIRQVSAVFQNDGHGHFTRHPIGDSGVQNSASLADIDGDGLPDVLIGATNGDGPELFHNNGDFSFTRIDLPGPLSDGFHDSFDAEFVDLTGDGRADIFSLSTGCNPADVQFFGACDASTNGGDAIFAQNADGTLADLSSLAPRDPRWVHEHKLIAADIDGDGDNDIVIVTNNVNENSSEQNRVLINRINEGLGFEVHTPSDLLNTLGDLYDLDSGDIDGDGDPDIVTTVCEGEVGEALFRNDNGVLVNDNSALPSLTQTCTVGSALVDLDDDGDLDLLFGGVDDVNAIDPHTHMRVLINRGDGTFVDGSDALPQFDNRHLLLNNFAVGDIDGDRDVDILVAGGAPYFHADHSGRVLVLHLE